MVKYSTDRESALAFLSFIVITKAPAPGNGVREQRRMRIATITSLLILCAPTISKFGFGTHFLPIRVVGL